MIWQEISFEAAVTEQPATESRLNNETEVGP